MVYIDKKSFLYRLASAFVAITFITSSVLPPRIVSAQSLPVLNLPLPGTFVTSTPGYYPTLIKGITINPDNPLEFDFTVDTGDSALVGEALREETSKLIKYFLASLTVPEEDMWVNLSPYEKERIIPNGFGDTKMGRDLLAQDYMLKQLTASLLYPEKELGKDFWGRVKAKSREMFGTTEIPMNTFNKVWIVPQSAVVYEDGYSAYVLESKLKVMLEEDYLAMKEVEVGNGFKPFRTDKIQTQIIREIVIPEITKEVNEGQTFANLRQIYHSMILAAWYKMNLKNSMLGQLYVDQNKTKGVDTEDKQVNQKIYNQYLEAFKEGVYDYIREDYDPTTQQVIPRKYFSGGAGMDKTTAVLIAHRRDNIIQLPLATRAQYAQGMKPRNTSNMFLAKAGVASVGPKANLRLVEDEIDANEAPIFSLEDARAKRDAAMAGEVDPISIIPLEGIEDVDIAQPITVKRMTVDWANAQWTQTRSDQQEIQNAIERILRDPKIINTEELMYSNEPPIFIKKVNIQGLGEWNLEFDFLRGSMNIVEYRKLDTVYFNVRVIDGGPDPTVSSDGQSLVSVPFSIESKDYDVQSALAKLGEVKKSFVTPKLMYLLFEKYLRRSVAREQYRDVFETVRKITNIEELAEKEIVPYQSPRRQEFSYLTLPEDDGKIQFLTRIGDSGGREVLYKMSPDDFVDVVIQLTENFGSLAVDFVFAHLYNSELFKWPGAVVDKFSDLPQYNVLSSEGRRYIDENMQVSRSNRTLPVFRLAAQWHQAEFSYLALSKEERQIVDILTRAVNKQSRNKGIEAARYAAMQWIFRVKLSKNLNKDNEHYIPKTYEQEIAYNLISMQTLPQLRKLQNDYSSDIDDLTEFEKVIIKIIANVGFGSNKLGVEYGKFWVARARSEVERYGEEFTSVKDQFLKLIDVTKLDGAMIANVSRVKVAVNRNILDSMDRVIDYLMLMTDIHRNGNSDVKAFLTADIKDGELIEVVEGSRDRIAGLLKQATESFGVIIEGADDQRESLMDLFEDAIVNFRLSPRNTKMITRQIIYGITDRGKINALKQVAGLSLSTDFEKLSGSSKNANIVNTVISLVENEFRPVLMTFPGNEMRALANLIAETESGSVIDGAMIGDIMKSYAIVNGGDTYREVKVSMKNRGRGNGSDTTVTVIWNNGAQRHYDMVVYQQSPDSLARVIANALSWENPDDPEAIVRRHDSAMTAEDAFDVKEIYQDNALVVRQVLEHTIVDGPQAEQWAKELGAKTPDRVISINDEKIIKALESTASRVSAYVVNMIEIANREHFEHGKIGGHLASAVPLVELMLSMHYFALRAQDHVGHKPHAGPTFYAIQYLLGHPAMTKERMARLRDNPISPEENLAQTMFLNAYEKYQKEFDALRDYTNGQMDSKALDAIMNKAPGLHSYPGMVDTDIGITIPTGSVGMQQVITKFMAAQRKWLRDQGRIEETDELEEPHYWAVEGEGGAEEGYPLESAKFNKKFGIHDQTEIIDVNASTLDGTIQDVDDTVRNFINDAITRGKEVIEIKFGRHLEEVFSRGKAGKMLEMMMYRLDLIDWQDIISGDYNDDQLKEYLLLLAQEDFIGERDGRSETVAQRAAGDSDFKDYLAKVSDQKAWDDIFDIEAFNALLDSFAEGDLLNILSDKGGHDFTKIIPALEKARSDRSKAYVIILHTNKGNRMRSAKILGHENSHSIQLDAKGAADISREQGMTDPENNPFQRFEEEEGHEAEIAFRDKVTGRLAEEKEINDRLVEKRRAKFRELMEFSGVLKDGTLQRDKLPRRIPIATASLDLTDVKPLTMVSYREILRFYKKITKKYEDDPSSLTDEEKPWLPFAYIQVVIAADVLRSTGIDPLLDNNTWGYEGKKTLGRAARRLSLREARAKFTPTPKGNLIRGDITEASMVLMAAGFGRDLSGSPTYPSVLMYDYFIDRRALDAWHFSDYIGAMMTIALGPSGIELSPEGASHTGRSAFLNALGLPNTIAWGYFSPHEIARIEADKGRRMLTTWLGLDQTPETRWDGSHKRSVVMYSNNSIKASRADELPTRLARNKKYQGQSFEEFRDEWEGDLDEGGYRLVNYAGYTKEEIKALMKERGIEMAEGYDFDDYTPGKNVINFVGTGPIIQKLLDASDALLRFGIYVNVISVNSPDLILGEHGKLKNNNKHLREVLIPKSERGVPIVTAISNTPEVLKGFDVLGVHGGVEHLGIGALNGVSTRSWEGVTEHFGLSTYSSASAGLRLLREQQEGLGVALPTELPEYAQEKISKNISLQSLLDIKRIINKKLYEGVDASDANTEDALVLIAEIHPETVSEMVSKAISEFEGPRNQLADYIYEAMVSSGEGSLGLKEFVDPTHGNLQTTAAAVRLAILDADSAMFGFGWDDANDWQEEYLRKLGRKSLFTPVFFNQNDFLREFLSPIGFDTTPSFWDWGELKRFRSRNAALKQLFAVAQAVSKDDFRNPQGGEELKQLLLTVSKKSGSKTADALRALIALESNLKGTKRQNLLSLAQLTQSINRPNADHPARVFRAMKVYSEYDHFTLVDGLVSADADGAMSARVMDRPSATTADRVGGINLNPVLLDMQIKRDGRGIPLPMNQQPVMEMNIEGFLPVIINITPITFNLPLQIGLLDQGEDAAQFGYDFKAKELEEISYLN